MRHGSLFSGIGGFDLAAEWCGWENVFHCEWNEFGQKVLKHYWPNSESFGDITKTDFTKFNGTVDVISGGFPCQPYSAAGKRLGKEDERHLWPEMLRVIREVRPRYVVGENVYGLLNWNGGLVFDEVHADLAAEGYETQAVVIPAAAVNAPHGRDRVWFVAKDTMRGGRIQREPEQERAKIRQFGNSSAGSANGVYLSKGDATDTYGERHTPPTESESIKRSWSRNNVESEKRSEQTERVNGLSRFQSNASDTLHEGLQGGKFNGTFERRKWEQDETRKPIAKLYKTTNWEQFPTQSPICGGDDGLPSELDRITFSKWRNESIKAYGNAIVPQVAYEIFKTIDFINKQENA